jgi:16S rRNA processing protein RimM
VIGVVAASHGLQGTLKLLPLSDFAERYEGLQRVYLVRGDAVLCKCTVKRAKWSGASVLLTTREITTRTEADDYRGVEVCVPESERWPLPPDVYYVSDLIGYRGVSVEGVLLGELTSVQQGAQDVLEFSGAAGELMVPFVGEWVGRVDTVAKTIEILNWERLLNPDVLEDSADSGDH